MYTDKKYWDRYWNREQRPKVEFYFSDLIDRYINWESLKSYMEIGGAPGSIMVFMNQGHGLKVSTVDFTERKRIEEFLKNQKVDDFKIYTEDFRTFDIYPHRERYDLVASWGFLEHFDRRTAAKFIEKQKRMVASDGYLIVELPNIRKVMWLLYKLFNRELLKIHNLEIMDLQWLKNRITRGGEFELLYASFHFTMNTQNEWFVRHKKLRKVCKKITVFFQAHQINDATKRWFFPYIVIIARKIK